MMRRMAKGVKKEKCGLNELSILGSAIEGAGLFILAQLADR
jgi:hypothetical protein